MIPKISDLPSVNNVYKKYFDSLKAKGFKGDIEYSHSSRLLVSTDNSVYQRMPQGVIFPKDSQDIVTALKLRAESIFKKLVITPRGGGTGTNGQSLNDGITIDCSRYMKEISDLNVENRSVHVQSGVIKDELNDFLKPHGLFFSPELSTSNRACVGGMISNDAAGQGSLKYGRTSSHIKEVTVVLADGTLTTFGPVSGDKLKECLDKDGLEGDITNMPGLGLLPIHTTITKEKTTRQVAFEFNGRKCQGYEIHQGVSDTDEAILMADHCIGTYIHGILDNAPFVDYLLRPYADKVNTEESFDYQAFKEQQYDRLADYLRRYVDIPAVYRILGNKVWQQYSS